MFAKAIRRGYIRHNPADGVPLEPGNDPIPVVLSDEEKCRLLGACPDLLWKALLFLHMTTACRRGELKSLLWEHVDFDQAFIRLT